MQQVQRPSPLRASLNVAAKPKVRRTCRDEAADILDRVLGDPGRPGDLEGAPAGAVPVHQEMAASWGFSVTNCPYVCRRDHADVGRVPGQDMPGPAVAVVHVNGAQCEFEQPERLGPEYLRLYRVEASPAKADRPDRQANGVP